MFYPLALFIGLRYTRAKRRNHFISFIALTSVIGIALSVLVLITVLSVMNGFDEVIHARVLSMARQVSVTSANNSLSNWSQIAKKLQTFPEVTATAPFIDGQGMLSNEGIVAPVMVNGILPNEEKKVSELADKMVDGNLNNLTGKSPGIVIGQALADNLHVDVGDKVNLFIPQASVTPVGIFPRFQRFTVVGIFKVGNGFGFDNSLAIIHLKSAQTLFNLGKNVSGVRATIKNIYQAPEFAHELTNHFSNQYLISDWTLMYGSLFDAIALEKTMMALILFLLVAIAAFNLVSTLVMVVTEKRADIAILRTLGATPKVILAIFMVQGTLVGLFGTLLGVLGGIAVSHHITHWVQVIEKSFHLHLMSANIYWVNYLPSVLQWSDVGKIAIAAIIMSFIATIYPAWIAAKILPAEALRYE